MAWFRATDAVVLVTLLCLSTQPSLGKDATLEKVFGAASHEHDGVNKTVSSGESTRSGHCNPGAKDPSNFRNKHISNKRTIRVCVRVVLDGLLGPPGLPRRHCRCP